MTTLLVNQIVFGQVMPLASVGVTSVEEMLVAVHEAEPWGGHGLLHRAVQSGSISMVSQLLNLQHQG